MKDEETLKYWETERPTGRLKRDNTEILLHCIGVIKGFYDPYKHTLSDLSKQYKQELKNIDSKEKLKEFIKEIIDYAKIYKEKIITLSKGETYSFDDSIKRLFHILEVLEISTFHPFILFVFKKYNDEEKIKKTLFELEKFIVRNMLGEIESDKNYSKLCKQFIDDLNSLTNKLNEMEWSKVSTGLRKVSSREAKLLLFWVELYRRYKDSRYDEKELKYEYELEHIMPIKWEEHWGFNYVPHPNNSLTPEEQKKDRNEKVRWLGNMTLLKSSLNKKIRNNRFDIKMEGDGRQKGIKHYATLSITRGDIVEPYERRDKVWDESKIEERTKKLEEEIKEIWGN
ncbi:MAG: HNH endonuclease family protein [Elusimicrobiota bacterium]|nr:DUF1524 domain-containing protein [Endomicrobiia bacterium]MDW7999076.1 HNH endonuclease family protein [Thermodesulfovibrio sp.]MDW8166584.1 HNH endonuclease family protein [Elusimicrobiota bacterium]